MNELEMIKAFAKLEGIDLIGELIPVTQELIAYYNRDTLIKYNPITDHTLTFKAMVDYNVEKLTSYYPDGLKLHTVHITDHNRVGALSDDELSHGIIKCILKSEGLWEDK